MIQNQETSIVLEYFVDISHQFRLALLFFISGIGVAFAYKRKSNQAFIIERNKRLLIPLLTGFIFIVPPMVYTEKLFLGQVDSGFITFYPLFFTQGIYPVGNLSWHHLWFIVYLYLFCILGLKIFTWLAESKKQRLNYLAVWGQGYGIYRFILPLLVVEICLRALFPGFRDLIHDWASFFHWFLIFLAGYVIANDDRLLNSPCRLRYISLLTAVLASCALYALFNGTELRPNYNDEFIIIKYLTYCLLRMTMVWCSILACLGFAARYLQFSNRLLVYLNQAVYPLFILHLSISTGLGYWVVGLNWNLWLKYLLITSLTIGISLCIYHFAIRPNKLMRLLFGVKYEPVIQHQFKFTATYQGHDLSRPTYRYSKRAR